MSVPSGNTAHLVCSLAASQLYTEPYHHWLLQEILTQEVVDGILALPIDPSKMDHKVGTRDYNNTSRAYFNPENLERHAVCQEVAETFQSREAVEQIERTCAIALLASYLRIEYAQDTSGFWLEPHTDIWVKLFTMQVYLSKEPEAADLGTDIYDAHKNVVKRVPFKSNHGLIFIPASNTWHGFSERPITGVRRSLIVNYVTGEWRDRFKLAYPDSPIV